MATNASNLTRVAFIPFTESNLDERTRRKNCGTHQFMEDQKGNIIVEMIMVAFRGPYVEGFNVGFEGSTT